MKITSGLELIISVSSRSVVPWSSMTKSKKDEDLPYFTYILKCADQSLYTGWTNDLDKRIAAHNARKGARYTRSRTPVELLACWSFATKREAMQREYQLKHLRRDQKLALIRSATDSYAKSIITTEP